MKKANSINTKQVLWISRHTMTPEQFSDLERIAGGTVMLSSWEDTVHDANELQDAITQADIIAAVLPVEMLTQVFHLAQGKPVIQSVSARVPLPETNEQGERQFAFSHQYWQQITQLEWAAQRL